jgi:hypothetical protein
MLFAKVGPVGPDPRRGHGGQVDHRVGAGEGLEGLAEVGEVDRQGRGVRVERCGEVDRQHVVPGGGEVLDDGPTGLAAASGDDDAVHAHGGSLRVDDSGPTLSALRSGPVGTPASTCDPVTTETPALPKRASHEAPASVACGE